jgi:hypothetical protein
MNDCFDSNTKAVVIYMASTVLKMINKVFFYIILYYKMISFKLHTIVDTTKGANNNIPNIDIIVFLNSKIFKQYKAFGTVFYSKISFDHTNLYCTSIIHLPFQKFVHSGL